MATFEIEDDKGNKFEVETDDGPSGVSSNAAFTGSSRPTLPAQATPPPTWKDKIAALARGFGQGVTSGWGDEASARAGNWLPEFGKDKTSTYVKTLSPEENYVRNRDRERFFNEQRKAESPALYESGNLGGGALQAGALAGAGVPIAGKAAGLVLGGIGGAGYSNANNLPDLLSDTATGAGFGVVASGVPQAAEAMQGSMRAAANNAATRALHPNAGQALELDKRFGFIEPGTPWQETMGESLNRNNVFAKSKWWNPFVSPAKVEQNSGAAAALAGQKKAAIIAEADKSPLAQVDANQLHRDIVGNVDREMVGKFGNPANRDSVANRIQSDLLEQYGNPPQPPGRLEPTGILDAEGRPVMRSPEAPPPPRPPMSLAKVDEIKTLLQRQANKYGAYAGKDLNADELGTGFREAAGTVKDTVANRVGAALGPAAEDSLQGANRDYSILNRAESIAQHNKNRSWAQDANSPTGSMSDHTVAILGEIAGGGNIMAAGAAGLLNRYAKRYGNQIIARDLTSQANRPYMDWISKYASGAGDMQALGRNAGTSTALDVFGNDPDAEIRRAVAARMANQEEFSK
jgi:hypothetical protein